jgi:hypothetical protein
MLSHASNVATVATWPWRDVAAESCCVTGVRIYNWSRDVRLGHVDDDAAEVTWPRHDVSGEPCS